MARIEYEREVDGEIDGEKDVDDLGPGDAVADVWCPSLTLPPPSSRVRCAYDASVGAPSTEKRRLVVFYAARHRVLVRPACQGRAAGHFAALNAIAVAVGYGVGGAIRASFETLEETMCGKQVALHAVQAARRKAGHAPTEADCSFAAAEEPWGCEQSDAHDGRVAAETKAAQRTASESTPPETPPETPSIKPPIKPPEERPLPSSLPPQSPSAARSPQQAQPSAPQDMTMHQQQQRRQQLLRQQQQQLQQEQLRQQCWQQQQVQQQQLQQQWQQQQQWEQHWHTQQWQQQNASGYLWVQPAVQPGAQPMHQTAGPHVSLGPYSDAYSHANRDSSSSGSGNGSGRSHPPEAIDGRSSELSDADTDKETRTQKRRRQRLALNARYTSGVHVEAES